MRTKTIKELKELIADLNDDDIVVLETIDVESGNVQDLYPLYVDVIDISRQTNGTFNEVRFCQMNQEHFDK